MKSVAVSQILVLCVAAFWGMLQPEAAAAQDQTQVKQTAGKATSEEQLNDEDREIIENLELLQNLELFLQDDLEMIQNLDIFLANS